jgi:pyruvate dehydrogenase E2 component (dihydrolipoamide acetyltransferase)
MGPEGTDISDCRNFKAKGAEERSSPVAAEEPKSAPAEKSEPIAQETSTDGQRILASPLAKLQVTRNSIDSS